MIMLCCILCSTQLSALDLGFDRLEKEQKLWVVNAGAMAFITAWGIAKWDYGARAPHMQSEGWFGNNTKEGGTDKLGHLWSTYAVAEGLSNLYRDWGYEQDQAGLYGSLSSFAIMGFMEFGDSFSNFGFAYEDLIMNALGGAGGYLMNKYPELARKIDLRWEYAPSFDRTDLFTDYEHTKYLVALQLGGFDRFKGTVFEYLELQLGYYARGFETRDINRERNIYFGVGLNLTSLLSKVGCTKLCNVLHYYQPPYTYLPLARDLND